MKILLPVERVEQRECSSSTHTVNVSSVQRKAFVTIGCIHSGSQYLPVKILKSTMHLLFYGVALLQSATLAPMQS